MDIYLYDIHNENIVSLFHTPLASCPEGWIMWNDETCLFFSTEQTSWDNAKVSFIQFSTIDTIRVLL
jgi:hypothetical protein